MRLLVQLVGALLLFVAGFELWRFLVGFVCTLIMKGIKRPFSAVLVHTTNPTLLCVGAADLLRNISIDPHTKLSVTAATVKISFWSQLWKFLRSPKREKLVVLELSTVHLLVVKTGTEPVEPPGAKTTSVGLTLDTSIGLQDLRHPVWKGVRAWIPRLLFICRCIHAIELGVGSISVDVVQKDEDVVTPVLSIQYGSVFVSAFFHCNTSELSFTAKVSQSQPMKVHIQQLGATAALGCTEISVRVPISQSCEDVRAPIPSAYSVVCDLIQVDLDFEHIVRLALQQHQDDPDPIPSDSHESENTVETNVFDSLMVLRLAEISPSQLQFDIRKVQVNIARPGAICALCLNRISVLLSDDSNEDLATQSKAPGSKPVVVRKADLTLGPLLVGLSEGDTLSDTCISSPMVKLDGLKVNAEGTLSVGTTRPTIANEIDENDVQQPYLYFKSTVNGESRGLDVTLSKRIEPWVASCCLIFDQATHQMQHSEFFTSSNLVENTNTNQDYKSSDMSYCEIELDAQFKLLKTDITLISLSRVCDVLPKGVPSVSLSLGEISVYAHPFLSEDNLGVRAMADIQCSRLKVFYFSSNDLVKNPFLSLDFARVFISPVETMIQTEIPAEVEMEAEWVEVKWAPEVLHAIGGMLELGVFTLGPFLHESRLPVAEDNNVRPDCSGWKASSSLNIPRMRQMSDVAQDNVSPGEVIVFRCAVKRICVTVPYLYNGEHHVDCVTVDTFAMSSEETTGRLRISIIDAKAFPCRRSSSESPSVLAKSSQKRGPLRRKSFTSRASRGRAMVGDGSEHDAVFFVADCFSLEENKVVGSTKTVIDLFVNGARMEWDLSTQLRVMELIRRITFSSWEMIYRARSAYAMYCTPPDSIYNRLHGLNPPLDDPDECSRYERLFVDLISASGDQLHRLHATNIFVNAKICAEIGVHLSVGVFAGTDLPETWLFEDISLKVNELEMAKVGVLRVRHTIDKQRDHVFGEFEDMLRKRLFACKRATVTLDQTLMDGMLIDISKIHLRTSRDFQLLRYADAVQQSFVPFHEDLASAMTSYWRPQQELFYQFFLRTPVASCQKDLWLRLDDVAFECLGNPLESWLEQMYPVWIEELAEQELRSHMLDDHVATLKLTNVELLSDDSYREIKTLLKEKNARMYIKKVKKLRSLSHESSGDCGGSLVSVSVGHLDVDVSFEEDIASSWTTINELDEATNLLKTAFEKADRNWKLFAPNCLAFVGVSNKTTVTDLTVRMRRFPTPLMSCGCLSVEGQVFLTAFSRGYEEVCSDPPFNLMAAARCFVNLSIDIDSPVLYFSPGYLYALDELARLASGFLPLAVPDIDKRHQTSLIDIVRRLIRGKIAVSIKDAGVRLLCAATSFESSDHLEIVVNRIRAAYTSGSIDVEITRVTAKIEPGSLSHIAELSHLKLQVWLKWGCLGDPSVHYLYPIEFVGAEDTSAAGERFVLPVSDPASGLFIPLSESSSRNPFQAYQATKLSVFISGRICPVDPDHGDLSNNDGWSKRDMAARTAVVLYSKNVEWLIGFGRLYQKVPLYPLPRRRDGPGVKLHLPSTNMLNILEGVTVEEFDLIGLDLALYASEKHSVGVRAFIDDKISCTGALLKSSHEVFGGEGSGSSNTVRRLSFPVQDSLWVVHDLNVDAQEIQVRVCTPESGSRGESLVSVKHISLIVGGGTERVPTHDNGMIKLHSPPPMKRTIKAHTFDFLQPTVEAKERPKQSILEYFDIPHENPFSYRDADTDVGVCDAGSSDKKEEAEECQNEVLDEFRRHGFLLGLLSKEVRVTVTMVALASLVDIADTWVQVVVASLPELFSDTGEAAALLKRKEDVPVEADIILEDSDPSPKKFTSLAQDPKFSGLWLQGGADAPASRDGSLRFEPTPYSNADTVRPSKRKSSIVTSVLEPLRHKEEESSPPRPTSSKLTQAFIMVKFEDCQISIQDQLHKGSMLLALNAGTLQHAVSLDSSHEHIDLNVDSFQVFTAPLDVDVKSHATWLKTLADGSYSPSSYGLLKQVIAPIPAQVTIWIDREKTLVKNRVKLEIPSIEVYVNLASKDILEKLAKTATELINAKLADRKAPDHSHLLHGYLRDAQYQERSLLQLIALKKQLKWKIAAWQWRQMCGWDYRMNERAMAAEGARTLTCEIETSQLFRRRNMSSASVSSATTSINMIGSTATNRYEDEQFSDELQRMAQQYESLSELTRFMAREIEKQLKPNPLPNVDLEFALDRASLTLSGDNVDIIRAQVGSLCFKMQLFEDHSGNFALTLRELSVKNLSPGTPYPDLLQQAYSRSWEGDDMFLRVDAEIAKPVGGITIVQHFEVNVHPIQVCITQEVILQLVAFFSPSDRGKSSKEEQRDEVRSHFLQARTSSSSTSDGRVGSAIIKAVNKVAGKAAAHPLSLGRSHRTDSDDELLSSSRKGRTLHHIAEDPSQWMAKLANLSDENELPLFGSTGDGEQHTESAERELREMKDRAKSSILFKRIRLGAVEVVLTYKNKKSNAGSSTPHLHLPHTSQPQALEDMRGFEVKTHALVYSDKTCSPMDLLMRLRRDIVLDVLSQVGRNFTNIGNFLRDQFDPSRWAAFDALAPLKSLSTSLTPSHPGAVMPLSPQSVPPTQVKDTDKESSVAGPPRTSLRLTELLSDHYDADSSTPNTPTSAHLTHPKHPKKRSLGKLFSRRKSLSSSPLPSPKNYPENVKK